MRATTGNGTGTERAYAAWWPLAIGALLALAATAAVATWLASPPGVLRKAQIPGDAAAWMPAYLDGAPRHWLEGDAVGQLGRLPRNGLTQVAVLLPMPPEGTGDVMLLLPAASGVPSVFVNSAEVSPDARVGAPYLAASRMRPVAMRVPRHFFRPGANRFDVVFDEPGHRALMAPPALGDEAVLAPAAERLFEWPGPLRTIAAFACLLAACLSLAASLFNVRRGWFLGLSAAAAAFGCRLLPTDRGMPPWLATDPGLVDQVLLAAALASLACAAMHRPRERAGHARGMAEGALVAMVVAAGLIAIRQVFEPLEGPWLPWMEAFYGCALVVVAAGLGTASAWTFGKDARRFAIVHFDLRRAVHRQRIEIERANRELELQRRRAAILEERQRLARDVHDGVGGTLASLLARIRMRHVDIGQIESELVHGLADLRLIVDSMDAADGSLATALGVFRARITPQAEAAGMSLRWEQFEHPAGAAEDPSWMLHLYRLMQEAVNNALRHSGGRNLLVSVRALDARRVRIEVADDGAGLPARPTGRGNGLANMAWRARRLGGSLRFEQMAGGGTRVVVEVELPGASGPVAAQEEAPTDATQPRLGISPS